MTGAHNFAPNTSRGFKLLLWSRFPVVQHVRSLISSNLIKLSKLCAKETSRILRNDCLGIKKRESVNSYALIKILDALFEMFPTGQMCI